MRKIVTIRPVLHTEDLPVPVPPQQYILDSDEELTEKGVKETSTFNICGC
jgi:hypothetical protein